MPLFESPFGAEELSVPRSSKVLGTELRAFSVECHGFTEITIHA